MIKHIQHYIAKLYAATINSVDGFKALWKHEWPFRQEIYMCVILVPVIFFMPISYFLKLLLIILLFIMLIVETLNSAIEAVVDRISLDYHPQSKIAKDMGSAAVNMSIIMNVMAWLYVIIFELPLFSH